MIQITRNITFGQYINNGSLLTRIDPRTKLFCFIVLTIVVSIIHSFLAFALCLLLCLWMHRLSRLSTAYVLRGFKPFLGFLAFIFVLQTLFYSAPAQHVFWRWGILSLSGEGLLYSATILVRVFFLYYLASLLLFVTSMVDFTDGLEALLSPFQKIGLPVNAFIMVFVVALKFIPLTLAEIERLVKAQAARGVRFDQGNFLQRTRKLAPLLVPLFLNSFKRAEALSTAMEARCYGMHRGWRRSKRRQFSFTRVEAITLIVVCLAGVLALVINGFAPV